MFKQFTEPKQEDFKGFGIIKSKKSNTFIYAFIFLCLITTVLAFDLPGYKEKLHKDKVLTEDKMDTLREENDKYRSEISVLQPRVDELNNKINKNKQKWNELNGKRNQINDMINQIEGLEGETSVSESVPLVK